jgi:hypothetical protein
MAGFTSAQASGFIVAPSPTGGILAKYGFHLTNCSRRSGFGMLGGHPSGLARVIRCASGLGVLDWNRKAMNTASQFEKWPDWELEKPTRQSFLKSIGGNIDL